MKVTYSNAALSLTSVTTNVVSQVIDTRTADSFSITSNITVDTNAAGTFAASSVSSNHVTITAHRWKTGIVGQLTTAGSLPTGLSTSTNYYIIVVDANTVKFASSYANAAAGTAISITGGSGNSTFTPTALAGATFVGQWSNDQITWIQNGSPVDITTAVAIGDKESGPIPYSYYQIAYTLTAGSLTVSSVYALNQSKQ